MNKSRKGFVLIGNPLIVLVLMRLLKFDTITGFKAGLTVAQISEFSLLVADMALKNGTITDSDLTMLTIVGGITMTGSSYMILYSDELYEKIRPTLKFFGMHKQEEYDVESYKRKQVADRVIIFGFNRMARSLEALIKKRERRFLVIDNDPVRLEYAEKLGATTAFGDLQDENLIHQLKLNEAHLIISTVPDMQANLGLLYYLKENDISVPTVVNAFYDQDAVLLYDEGADFVIHPYILVSGLLERIVMNKDTKTGLKRAAAKDIDFLSKYK
jgi:voltage-gated potassium channel Kch